VRRYSLTNVPSYANSPLPVIFGCSGPTLTTEERAFFQEHQPLGFIIFKRNVQDKAQLKELVEALKATVDHPSPPILIDQEGGRVARLTTPHWIHPPAAAQLVDEDREASKKRIYETYKNIASDLVEVGISVNCAPLLDLHVLGADPIMGDRTFGSRGTLVGELGAVAIQALQDGGVISVMKHLPGHGAATCDSHEELPVVTLTREELEEHFLPFKMNASCPWGMTAHIIYSAIDPHYPATQSSLVIQSIIREHMGFKGLLISDDVGMKALSGSFAERAYTSLIAGCDVVLHCSGNMLEMKDVIQGIVPFAAERKTFL
jgi:beta-N-acetylhexosaminidase